jgi:nondiscriminating aspartyl-tRNA synthetase
LKREFYANEISSKAGETVRVAGWVDSIRELSRVRFVLLRDKTGIVQVTIRKSGKAESDTDGEVERITSRLNLQDVIAVTGKVASKAIAKAAPEIFPSHISVLSTSQSPLPLDLSGGVASNLDTRLDWRVLDLRKPTVKAIFQIQSKLILGLEKYLEENGFTRLSTPCLLGGISEGGAEVFSTNYFGHEAYLRQDPQLHRQLSVGAGFDKLYDLGPIWRAESSHTPRHLCEMRNCAVEIGFIDSELDVNHVEEQLISSAFAFAKREAAESFEALGVELEVPKPPFPELRFPEIYSILEANGKKTTRGEDLDAESERILTKYVKEKFGSDIFFVNRFPYKKKPFYVAKVDEDPDWARSVDLIYKGVELSSGGQREHRYEKIMQQIKEKGLSPSALEWFTEPFKYGFPPHGGFSLGIERTTMQALNLSNIREASLFPRTPERLLP